MPMRYLNGKSKPMLSLRNRQNALNLQYGLFSIAE